MDKTPKKLASIKLSLPAGLMENAKLEAKQIGVSVQDLIRMLLISYFARGLVSFTGHRNFRPTSPQDKVADILRQSQLIEIKDKQQLNEYFKKFKKSQP